MKNRKVLTGPILIADNDAQVVDLAASVLRPHYENVLTTTKSPDAVTVIYRYMDDLALLVTDLAMPAAGGWMLANLVAAICPDTPVLVMSAEPVNAGFSSRRLGFLPKPFTHEQLADACSKMLGGEISLEDMTA